jgi:hypothetical protein
MPYLNTRLHALLAVGLLLLAAPALHAQEASVVSAQIRGDVNGDGQVNAADAEAVRAYLVRGTVPAGRSMLPAGDANGDGRVTAADAALISRFAAGVDVSRFPVGRAVGDERVETTDITRMRLVLFSCTTSVSARVTNCRRAAPGGDAAMFNIIVGDEAVDVTSSNVVVSNGNPANTDTTTLTWTLTNRMDQAIGTTDGINPAPVGSRLFFYSGPTADSLIAGSRAAKYYPITPVGALTANFTSVQGTSWNNKKYYQFDGVIQKDASVAREVSFVYSSNVLAFEYFLLLATPVKSEHGRVILTPLADSIVRRDTSFTIASKAVNYLAADTADVLNWSSSVPAVASVHPTTGLVTTLAEGTTTITATDVTTPSRTSASLTIVVDRFPEVSSTTPADGATNVLPTADIDITFTEPVTVTNTAFDLKCPSSGSLLPYTLGSLTGTTITLNPNADLPAGTVCEVTVKGNQVQDVDTNDGPNFMPGQYQFDFEVGIEAVNDVFGSTTTGNVQINSANASPVFSVTDNDKLSAATTITFAGWGGTPGKTFRGGDVVMTMSGADRGKFTYNPPAGYEGVDSLEYTIESGSSTSTAHVALPVSGMIWFIGAGGIGTPCNPAAPDADKVCGRLLNPFPTLAAFQGVNNGSGDYHPAAGDNIFLYENASPYTGPVTLLTQQKLIGQDAGASLSTITGITPATGSLALPAMNPAGDAVTIVGGSGGVVLANIGAASGANNTVRGLSIATTGGAGLSGTSFGSPVIAEVTINVTNGPSLSLSGGTMSSTFANASSANSTTQGMSLTNLAGTLTFGSGTTLTNAAGTVFLVSGGAPAITYSGAMNKDGASVGRLIDISGVTGGTNITFNTGTLSSTSSAGTGIQLSNAAGTVSFNGTTTLNGGDAGVDIVSGSTGTFTFNANTLVQNPTGTAFNVNGSTPTVTYNGSLIRTANNALLVDLTTVGSGTITFDPAAGTDSLYATIGDGIQLSNADGAVDFNGRVRLAGGNAGVDIVSGSSGNIDFDAATIVNPTGDALRVFNGSGGDQATDVSFAGSITTNAGRPVLVEDMSSGSVAVSASIAATGQGILVQNNSGGTVTFSNATQTLNTAANAAVTLSSNTNATVNFTGGALAITTTSGAGLNASGGGTVSVTGANNTVNSTAGGIAVNVANTTIGASGLRFQSISASGATNGIVLNNTGSTNGLQVTGTGGAGSGGTITGTTGDAVSLTSARSVRLTSMNIQNSGGSGIYGSSLTNFSLRSSTVSGNGNAVGEAGLEFDNLLGTDSVVSSTITGSAEDNLVVRNTSGMLDSLLVMSSTISSNSAIGSDGILVTASNTANATVRVRNNTFTANKGDHFQATASNSAILNVVLFQNTMTGGHPTALGQGVTLGTGLTFTGTFTYDLNDNDILNGPISNAITIDHDGTTGSLMQGRVRNNVIGTSGVDLSCSAQASGIEIENGNRGTHTYAVTGNTIRRCYDRGIFLDNGDGANVVVNATVTGNTVNELTTVNARQALYVNVGAFDPNFLGVTDSFTVCADIQGNTLASHPSFSTEAIRLRMRFNSRMNLPGYVGSFNNASNEVNTYLAGRNTLTASATATTTASGAPNGYYNIASCPTPP